MKEVNIENGKVVLKNLKNFLHIEHINYKVPKAENAAIAITAPNVSEYSFVCWIGVASQGFVKSCYIDRPDKPNSTIWFANTTVDIGDDTSVNAYALYVKD